MITQKGIVSEAQQESLEFLSEQVAFMNEKLFLPFTKTKIPTFIYRTEVKRINIVNERFFAVSMLQRKILRIKH